jgi:hypothetical protein
LDPVTTRIASFADGGRDPADNWMQSGFLIGAHRKAIDDATVPV